MEEVNKFFEQVQGSDELKSAFISKFAEVDFGKNFIDKVKENNKVKYFDTDENGKIINNESLDPKIGEFIGFERLNVHTKRDKEIQELTGIDPKEGEGKGYAARALSEWRDKLKESSKSQPNEQIEALKSQYEKDLDSIKKSSSENLNEWEKKYNDLQNEHLNALKKADLGSELSKTGIKVADLDKFQKAFYDAKVEEIKGMISYTDGKMVLKNSEGTVLRKANQEDYVLEDLVNESLQDLITSKPVLNGGGANNGSQQGGLAINSVIQQAAKQSEAYAKLSELLQKQGISRGDEEWNEEFLKLGSSKEYQALPM